MWAPLFHATPVLSPRLPVTRRRWLQFWIKKTRFFVFFHLNRSQKPIIILTVFGSPSLLEAWRIRLTGRKSWRFFRKEIGHPLQWKRSMFDVRIFPLLYFWRFIILISLSIYVSRMNLIPNLISKGKVCLKKASVANFRDEMFSLEKDIIIFICLEKLHQDNYNFTVVLLLLMIFLKENKLIFFKLVWFNSISW